MSTLIWLPLTVHNRVVFILLLHNIQTGMAFTLCLCHSSHISQSRAWIRWRRSELKKRLHAKWKKKELHRHGNIKQTQRYWDEEKKITDLASEWRVTKYLCTIYQNMATWMCSGCADDGSNQQNTFCNATDTLCCSRQYPIHMWYNMFFSLFTMISAYTTLIRYFIFGRLFFRYGMRHSSAQHTHRTYIFSQVYYIYSWFFIY